MPVVVQIVNLLGTASDQVQIEVHLVELLRPICIIHQLKILLFIFLVLPTALLKIVVLHGLASILKLIKVLITIQSSLSTFLSCVSDITTNHTISLTLSLRDCQCLLNLSSFFIVFRCFISIELTFRRMNVLVC